MQLFTRCVFALAFGVAATFEARRVAADGVDADLGASWELVDGRYWQLVGLTGEPRSVTDEREGTRGSCPEGMVEIHAGMKQSLGASIESLQNTTCSSWIDRNFPERCAQFDAEKWKIVSAPLPIRTMHYCIDRFEYPNRRGANPAVFVTWHDAVELCGSENKRVCTEDEWTFACEGEEARPYPTGYVRDPMACVIDRPWRAVNERALGSRDSERTRGEIARLWQGRPSGENACRSPFGVYDMTGNVDEWTSSAIPGERPSILKGGYWGPVRTRCRPSTRAHGPDYSFYQQGFRCCRMP